MSWARAALLMQGLDDEAVIHALQTLTKPVELDIGEEHDPEPVKSQAGHLDGSSVDHLMDCMSGEADLNDEKPDLVQAKPMKPQRQGNPRFDPLAELCPDEPEAPTEENEHSRVNVKCQRHDDWIIHCGCRADDNQSLSSKHRAPGADPYEGYEYVLVEKAEDDHENGTKDNVSVVNKTICIYTINTRIVMCSCNSSQHEEMICKNRLLDFQKSGFYCVMMFFLLLFIIT